MMKINIEENEKLKLENLLLKIDMNKSQLEKLQMEFENELQLICKRLGKVREDLINLYVAESVLEFKEGTEKE